MERAAILCDGETLHPRHLPGEIREATSRRAAVPSGLPFPDAPMTLETLEQWYLLRVLEQAGGNRTEAARLLGISRSTLKEKLRRYAGQLPAAGQVPASDESH
jgi:DNA-binding NtrC family response regulator